jgi:LytS/YehU family sensor histidine kinase
MHEDVDRADRMITRLSDLLRRSMRGGDRPEVPLEEELETLQAYVEIMQARFEGRLSVEVEIDEGARSARVPPFLLQPLVENSIKHGIDGRRAGGRIRVTARREADRLRIQVTDDGPGPGAPADRLLSKGIGLSSTVERLTHLYGPEGRLEIQDEEGGGTRVDLLLPYRVKEPT